MDTNNVNVGPRNRNGHRFRFSLRTLLIFTAICAIAAAWLAKTVERKRNERKAADAIVKLGGRVTYDYQNDPNWVPGPHWYDGLKSVDDKRKQTAQKPSLVKSYLSEVTTVDLLSGHTATDADLVWLKLLPKLRDLSLGGSAFTDAGLATVKELTDLESLTLADTAVTDGGLVNIEGLSLLRALNLYDTRIGDPGLAHLKGLARLDWLVLTKTKITDVGIQNLIGLQRLSYLDLEDTTVSDVGLQTLQSLPRLRFLILRGTPVTKSGIANLRKAVPNCEVDR